MYKTKLLAINDYYGFPVIPQYVYDWLDEHIVNGWSVDILNYDPSRLNGVDPKPKDWPIFFEIEYKFNNEEDLNLFKKHYN